MAAWLRWLDDEGYPIHEAIDQFYDQVASRYSTELESLKSGLIDRLHEPNGLEVLDRIIDSQEPEFADGLHHFMDQAISKSSQSYRIAGGTHTKAIVGGAVGLTLVVGAVGLKKRSNRLKREGFELENRAVTALRTLEKHIDADIEKDSHRAASEGRQVAVQASKNTNARDDYLKGGTVGDKRFDEIEIQLERGAKSFSQREVDFIAKNCARGLAKESISLMERADKSIYDKVLNAARDHFKEEILRKDGWFFVEAEGGKKVVKPMLGGINMCRNLNDFPDVDRKAEELAKGNIQGFFADSVKKAMGAALREARDSVEGEVKSIKISFGDAYKDATANIKDDYKEIQGKIINKADKTRRVVTDDLTKAEQTILGDVDEGAEFEMIFTYE